MENCTFAEHPGVLAKLKLLANKSIYWPKADLVSGSEQSDCDVTVENCIFSFSIVLDTLATD